MASKFPQTIEAGGVVLNLTPDEVYVEFDTGASVVGMDEFFSKNQLQPLREEQRIKPGTAFNQAFPHRRWLVLSGGQAIEPFVDQMQAEPQVRVASPVYHRADRPEEKTGLSFSDRVLVRFEPGAKKEEISAILKELGAQDTSEQVTQVGGELYRIRIPDPAKENAFDVAARLAQLPIVAYAGPDWMQLHPALSTTTPNDTLFANQWDMTTINAPNGWDISTGSSGVVIAIVDTGCDLGHQDLSSKYVPVADRRDVVAGNNTPDDDFGHGTCCAGIAAAQSNNAQGVAGVAWNSLVMPIRLMQNGFINSEADIVSATNWAQMHGADVVSMSWHWDGPHSNADVAFTAADAANVVLVAASGNSNTSSVNYPASHAAVMSIGASDQSDHRKSPASPDGECWGSQFGTKQSVMAPGVLCWSPNNTNGGASFNNNNGGPTTWACVNYASTGTNDGRYFALMNGTSAATPHVAGLAGLILSVCPTFTSAQVRDRIEQTADKVGGVVYAVTAGHPNGTWNQEMGYGRINVLRALQKTVPTINWVPAGIVYGTPLGAAQLNATASVPGTFSYSPAAGTCLPAGAHTLTATFTPNDTCSFSSVTASAVVNVAKATPILSWSNPPDIDFGTPLTNTQLNVPLPTWVVCGASGPVGGSFTYNPGAGTVLSVGTHTLCVTFTPTDTANYNNATACVQIHVLTGYPIVLSCTFAPTTLQREERTQVIVVIKNDSVNPHPTQGPPPGFEYSEGDTFLTGARPGRESFPSIAGAYRIAVDVDMVPYPYTQRYLYRWGFGHDLGPGEVVSVNGFIRMHNSRQNAPYYVAMIEEVDNVLIDHQCPTPITVEKP